MVCKQQGLQIFCLPPPLPATPSEDFLDSGAGEGHLGIRPITQPAPARRQRPRESAEQGLEKNLSLGLPIALTEAKTKRGAAGRRSERTLIALLATHISRLGKNTLRSCKGAETLAPPCLLPRSLHALRSEEIIQEDYLRFLTSGECSPGALSSRLPPYLPALLLPPTSRGPAQCISSSKSASRGVAIQLAPRQEITLHHCWEDNWRPTPRIRPEKSRRHLTWKQAFLTSPRGKPRCLPILH